MKDKLKKIIQEKLEFGDIEIDDDAHLKEKLGLDSIDFLSFVIMIENDFKIKINDNEVNKENFYSINTIEKFIKDKGGTL